MYREIVGYQDFHEIPHFNFQFNRWRPFLLESDIVAAADRISSFDTWPPVFMDMAHAAEDAGEWDRAAFLFRAAEIFMSHGDEASSEVYDAFQRNFDRAEWEFSYRLEKVPYEDKFLPAYLIDPAGSPIDTIVIHGGFDSFAEELLPQLASMADCGFRLILFEGPGQGYCLNKLLMPMTKQWELPVKAVLDHFKVAACSLLGISLGGCLALRAAAVEPRIKRVIADDVLESYYGALANRLGARRASVLDFMLRHKIKGPVNRALARARAADPVTRWGIDHGLRVSGCETPFDYFNWAKEMTTRDISHLVEQDCLLLVAKDDHLVPYEQFPAQVQTLTNARSLTCRVFTAEEQASQHCHVGNQGLARQVMVDWLLERIETR